MTVSFSRVATEDALIWPAALAVNEPRPTSIADQTWLIKYSGVGILDLNGNNSNDWRREILFFYPNVTSLLNFAIGKYHIPLPPPPPIGHATPQIDVDPGGGIASYAAISSAFEKSSGGADFGFAVDNWRPNAFWSGTDAFGHPVSNIFQGINFDIAVRNTNAVIHRVSFQITIIGKIAFIVQR
jgi:hypothetical protein